ncbi:MAG: mechanosensitive ion channel [Desulfobulbaceae bacterium]|jgi:miniconductance mechanosensitive channel|nr:mechanosensitive ion channel [Desulfobulbaceae bacterium]
MSIPVAQFLQNLGMSQAASQTLTWGIIAAAVVLVAVLATWLVRNIVVRTIIRMIRTSRYSWDDALINNRFFDLLTWYVPVVILYLAKDLLLPVGHAAADFFHRLLLSGFVIVSIRCVIALLRAIDDMYRAARKPGSTPIRGYIDAAKIVTYVFGTIFILAVLTDRSPWGLFSILGGLTAVTMLVFKDTILGFVASIQLSGTDMVRIGDWIEMPSHGADGDVIDISIHCVRVQNWDKTITTIPTYALVANPFKNWRGMAESGGRRIKRALNIDMSSIRFITDDELDSLGKIHLLGDYIRQKQKEIEEDNKRRGVDTSVIINGRRQTNIGVFRAYIAAYLRQHPKINKEMTFLIRHLQPGEYGLPVEIYVFSSDKVWAHYEAIQADIFDHLLAALRIFDLRVFQNPTGSDFRRLGTAPEEVRTIGSPPAAAPAQREIGG